MSISNHSMSTVTELASRFLAWALPNNLVEPVLGDLSEEYNQRLVSTNEGAAKLWYVRQAIRSGIGYMFITKRNFIMFIFSLCFFALMTFYVMYIAAGISAFIDIPSIIILLPTTLAFI
ncbi:MAG: hypothetical protein HRU25_13550 [Psychrobium sp.]|nr:hypothetical protein [Psychrobium sp.]